MRLISLFLLLSIVNGFILLDNVECILPKILTPCEDINPFFLQKSLEVAGDLREVGLPIFIGKSINATGTICNRPEPNDHYGYMSYSKSGLTTNVTISEDLFPYTNTLYNVILHELVHSLGLDHNEGQPGLMSYQIRLTTWLGYIINDCRKLWISTDDVRGILKSCFSFNRV